jgi:phosphatidylglycerol:prolipoprotein diacylglycerol transferase
MIVGFSLFGLLMFLRRKRKFSGQVFLGWVIGYGLLRPVIEALRDDDQRGTIGPLSTSQFIGFTSVILGSALLVHLVRQYRRNPESLRLWEHPILSPAPAGGPSSGGAVAGARGKRKKRR